MVLARAGPGRVGHLVVVWFVPPVARSSAPRACRVPSAGGRC
ncbi:hypothetical protein AB3662_42650 [Sorangium cellulosum]